MREREAYETGARGKIYDQKKLFSCRKVLHDSLGDVKYRKRERAVYIRACEGNDVSKPKKFPTRREERKKERGTSK
jgi:hypothetical protein